MGNWSAETMGYYPAPKINVILNHEKTHEAILNTYHWLEENKKSKDHKQMFIIAFKSCHLAIKI